MNLFFIFAGPSPAQSWVFKLTGLLLPTPIKGPGHLCFHSLRPNPLSFDLLNPHSDSFLIPAPDSQWRPSSCTLALMVFLGPPAQTPGLHLKQTHCPHTDYFISPSNHKKLNPLVLRALKPSVDPHYQRAMGYVPAPGVALKGHISTNFYFHCT